MYRHLLYLFTVFQCVMVDPVGETQLNSSQYLKHKSRILLSKRMSKQRDDDELEAGNASSSNGIMILFIVLLVFVGIPAYLYFANKYNFFKKCSSDTNISEDAEYEDGRKRKKLRKKQKKSKYHRKSSRLEDVSDMSDSKDFLIDDREEELNRRKRKKLRDKSLRLRNEKRLQDLQMELDPATVINKANMKKELIDTDGKSASSEYAYFVYKPERNCITVSRSLKSVLPPNTDIIYKMDGTSNAKDGQRLRSLRKFSSSPKESSPVSSLRSDYYIVNSNLLLNQSNKESLSDEKQNSKVGMNKGTIFVYSTKTRLVPKGNNSDNEKKNQISEKEKILVSQSYANSSNHDRTKRLRKRYRDAPSDYFSEQDKSDEDSLDNKPHTSKRRRLRERELSKRSKRHHSTDKVSKKLKVERSKSKKEKLKSKRDRTKSQSRHNRHRSRKSKDSSSYDDD